MVRLFLLLGVCLLSSCVSNREYDPLHAELGGPILLNSKAFSQLREGMSMTEAHNLLGQQINIGYVSSDPNQGTNSQLKAGVIPPVVGGRLSIANPYALEEIKTPRGVYAVEYYVTIVHQPQGTIKEDELMPLIFKEGKYIGRGRLLLESLQEKPPSL